MYRRFFILFLFLFLFFAFRVSVHAELPEQRDYHEEFVRGTVEQIVQSRKESFGPYTVIVETMRVKLEEGRHKGLMVTVQRPSDPTLFSGYISAGEMLVIDSKPVPDGTTSYIVYEPYRLNLLWLFIIGFILFSLLIVGRKGFGALLGMGISLGVVGLWIIPRILHGGDPLQTIIAGCICILIVTTYTAHGISLKTTIAIAGTAFSLLFATLLSFVMMQCLHIFGYGNQDVSALQVGTFHQINPQGLLLGSVLLGTLGALNDITTTQAITIFTFIKENPKQHFWGLFKKGMVIGDEHIASLINTLILAYAGSSLAVFIFFEINSANLPWWFILNNEATMEEILKMLVGSSALILAVPLTTALAAWIASKKP